MLQPKRTKFRKQMTGHNRGLAHRGSKVSFGEFALKAVGRGRLTARQIEAARRALTRHVKRGGKIWIRVFPDKPISKKPLEVRMGKGKGNVEYWVAQIRPGKVLILGAGVAGLQAIATARRLGAKVEAFDVRPAVKEQIESLGAKFLETDQDVTGEGEGGYAKELSEEQHQRELELIAAHIIDTDLVITTAQIPGRPAPRLITEEMVDSMKPGSVIVDLAAASGGNCAITREGETVVRNGVKVMGPANLPAEIPVHASQMFSKNVETLLKELVNDEELSLDFEDEIVAATCVTHAGEIRHGPTKERLA